MSFVRPELLERLVRGREMIFGLGVTGAGVWALWMGGYFFVPVGLVLLAVGLAWSLLSLRRMRFAQQGDAPGMVEIDEGRITYLGPLIGGSVGLPDLVDIRLLTLRGKRLWRLRQGDGQTILIPVEAAGADRLFDAFAALPGMDTQALVAAVTASRQGGGGAVVLDGEARLVWQRTERGVVVR